MTGCSLPVGISYVHMYIDDDNTEEDGTYESAFVTISYVYGVPRNNFDVAPALKGTATVEC